MRFFNSLCFMRDTSSTATETIVTSVSAHRGRGQSRINALLPAEAQWLPSQESRGRYNIASTTA